MSTWPTPPIPDGSITAAKFAAGAVKYQTVKNPAGAAEPQEPTLKFTGSPVTVSDVGGETVVDVTPGADTDFYQTAQDNGVDKTQRGKINFIGFTVADNAGNGSTDITAPTDTDFYQTVKDPAGSALTQRAVLKFSGAGIGSVADSGGETVVTVPGGGGATFAGPTSNTGAASNSAIGTGETTRASFSYTPAGASSILLIIYQGVVTVNMHTNTDDVSALGRLYVGATKISEQKIEFYQATVGTVPGGLSYPVSMVAFVTGFSGLQTIAFKDIKVVGSGAPDVTYNGANTPGVLTLVELIP